MHMLHLCTASDIIINSRWSLPILGLPDQKSNPLVMFQEPTADRGCERVGVCAVTKQGQQGSSAPKEPSGQAQDISSPIPRRPAEAQAALTRELLSLPTMAERLTHLLEHESDYYLLKGDPVVDREHIERLGPKLQHLVARAPLVAGWVRTRTGQPLTSQALHNFKTGLRKNTRPAIGNALGEFWRIHPLLLDPDVPESYFTAPDNEVDRRTLELMTQIGFLGVNARDVRDSLASTADEDKQDLLMVLDRIARNQRERDQPDS